ncbi:MAG: aminotransferase class V-fold PLP-dependent enzyme [Acidobacteria bacterium]|nr:aminotransferase class V-fold PLP-dependent enzyme [Acidobacteriota bacterium]
MGYNDSATQEIWRQYRHEFPVTDRLIYLNHAAVAPLSRRAAEAIQWLAQDALDYGSHHYPQWMEAVDGLKAAVAKLIHATPGEVATVKNTSEGIATVALGLKWKAGDKIVAFREEFPANFYIWKKLEEWHGVRVEWLSCFDPLEKIEAAARGARLLAISFVQYLSGYRADLEAIGEICHRHGVFFFVDAIQGLGVFPLDVRKARIHALAADGHKWLLGPEGCGIIYIQQDRQDEIEPVEFGWTTVAGWQDYSSRDMAVRRDAGRYECGTLNAVGCFGLRASVELLLEAGIPRISAHVQHLADILAEGAKELGYELLAERTPGTGAGIVSVRKPGVDARLLWSKLKENGVTSAPRQGWVRFSPHFYISPDDIAKVLDLLR